MKNNIILIDVDSVLLLWREGFKLYMKHQGHEWLDIANDYNMSNHFDLSPSDVHEHIIQFNNGRWEFGVLHPVDGAVNGMKILTEIGYKFVAISSCSVHPQSKALRQANLYAVFGDIFDAVHCVAINESKETHLADYDPTFWIEDNFKNCVDGIKYGHKCILLHQEWNKNNKHDQIKRCHSWAEIVDFIIENKDFNNILS